MSTESQKIAGIFSKLTPFRAIAQDADAVIVQPASFGPPPSFNIVFGKFTSGVDAIPGTPMIPQKSGPGSPGYVPMVPAVPDTPAIPPAFAAHRSETLTLTPEEWNAWPSGDLSVDNTYILSLVAKRFGQTLVP